MILLSIRTTVKVGIGYSPAELVFGTTLRLPGEFVAPSTNVNEIDPTKFTDRFRYAMQHLQPIAP